VHFTCGKSSDREWLHTKSGGLDLGMSDLEPEIGDLRMAQAEGGLRLVVGCRPAALLPQEQGGMRKTWKDSERGRSARQHAARIDKLVLVCAVPTVWKIALQSKFGFRCNSHAAGFKVTRVRSQVASGSRKDVETSLMGHL
jgi:hypothetical protein